MRIAPDRSLGPCPTCLRMRGTVKRLAAKLAGAREYPFELIITSTGVHVILDGPTGEVRVASDAKLVGRKIYRSRRWLFDIDTADRLDSLGTPVTVVGLYA